MKTESLMYASFTQRFFASIVDGFVVMLSIAVFFMLSSVLGNAIGDRDTFKPVAGLLTLIFYFWYHIYFTAHGRQTVGRKLLKIKVIKEEDHGELSYKTAFVREVIARTASSSILCLGYLWAIWDKRKQAWHDKIAETFVVSA